MALIAGLSVAMFVRQRLEIERVRLVLEADRMRAAAQLPLVWAISELNNQKNNFLVADATAKVLDMPKELSTLDPTVKMSASLYDLQTHLNLNNLIDPMYFIVVQRYLLQQQPVIPDLVSHKLLLELYYWISPAVFKTQGSLQNKFQKLDEYYKHQTPSYGAAHQWLVSVTELRLLKNITAQLYMILKDNIVLLPEFTTININTAPIQVLRLLTDKISEQQLHAVLQIRKQQNMGNQIQLLNYLVSQGINKQYIALESQYFMCVSELVRNGLRRNYTYVFKRMRDKHGVIHTSLIMANP